MANFPLLASPAPSANGLQSHLYLAFLQGRTADVALRIRGSWHAVYNLHRVVLIQSVSAVFSHRIRLGLHGSGVLPLFVHGRLLRVVSQLPPFCA